MSYFRKSIQFGIVFVVLANTYISTCMPAHGTGQYLALVQRKIKKAWNMPEKTPKKPVKVRFKIELDGSLDDAKVYQSCGMAECDRAALDAVEKAAPFDELPKGATTAVEVEYTFDYLKEKKELLKQGRLWPTNQVQPQRTKKGAK